MVALAMIVLAVAQVTWAPRLEVAGAFPNLALVAIASITWTNGAREAMVWACLGGVLLDLAAPGPIGPHAVALLAGAYSTGFWQRNLARPGLLFVALSAALGTVLYSTVLLVVDGALGISIPPFLESARLTAAAAVYNALLMPPSFWLVRGVIGAMGTRPEPA